ncbi:hypothetical protein FS749_016162 [Ceratobasidium sp. UAMH 11750]|nr:hypothetical protein FS749_016162 [Ceratobasidium sp. UAMH 11750]
MAFTLSVAHLGVFPVEIHHGESLGLLATAGHAGGDAEGLLGLSASLAGASDRRVQQRVAVATVLGSDEQGQTV